MRSPRLLLLLALAGAAASLRCPGGHPCPAAPPLPSVPAESAGDPSGHVCPDGSACTEPLGPPQHHPAATPRAVQCPDGESECPESSTCCVMPSGAWGCCPMPEAACCPDKVHCCPRATVCDLAHGRCLAPTGQHPLATKFPAWKRQAQPWLPVALGQVICPDGRSACPDGATCCPLPSGPYGCCPLQNAVCCSDHLHCCPQGTACDLERAKCSSVPGLAAPLARLAAAPAARDVRCDDVTSCPDGNTCCQLSSGKWGCCPLEQAVCCPDHVHCCPHGYTCDPEGGSCLQGGTRLPWHEKTPARTWVGDVKCEDETSCPEGNTCCQLSSGKWGCCPLEQAVCCPDHVHCCPQGYTCDPEGGSCLQGGTRLPWHEKTPARTWVGDVKCEDETSCPEGNTCCQLSSGKWGCCPLEQAVCCPDHVHCCPQGYTCDPEGGSCLQGGTRLPWHEKTPARTWVGDVKCEDETSCPEGNTCCQLSSGKWGCCPLEQAVCCSDGIHCCPSGFSCDLAHGTCSQGQPAALPGPAGFRVPAVPVGGRAVRCNATATCADGQTCCRNRSGDWACCQLPSAVCCKDREHCCPWGYTCNVAAQSCEKQRPRPPALQAARSVPAAARPCGAARSCHHGEKRCAGPRGSCGCCPFAEGSCCSDGRHCCPPGSICALGSCHQRQPLRWDMAAAAPARGLL